MLISALSHGGSYFAPRSRSSKWCLFVLLSVLLLIVVSYRSGFLHYMIETKILGRKLYSKEELLAIIPSEASKQVLFGTGLAVQHQQRVVHSPNSSNALECKPLYPKVVFVIRIAKCASTSFVELLKKLSKASAFELFFHASGAFDWDARLMKQVADMAKAKQQRFVYARHFYYVDFRPYDLREYKYVTLIRDPVSRFVSSFLYYHFSSKAHIQAILNPVHKNETLLTCLEHQHGGCAHNLMTKYFCGHHRFCKLGNKEALRRAMENMERDFAVVGLVEEMDLSLRVLAKTVPQYFGKLATEEASLINKNERQMKLTELEVNRLRQANSADLELYKHAQQLLHKKASACGL